MKRDKKLYHCMCSSWAFLFYKDGGRGASSAEVVFLEIPEDAAIFIHKSLSMLTVPEKMTGLKARLEKVKLW